VKSLICQSVLSEPKPSPSCKKYKSRHNSEGRWKLEGQPEAIKSLCPTVYQRFQSRAPTLVRFLQVNKIVTHPDYLVPSPIASLLRLPSDEATFINRHQGPALQPNLSYPCQSTPRTQSNHADHGAARTRKFLNLVAIIGKPFAFSKRSCWFCAAELLVSFTGSQPIEGHSQLIYAQARLNDIHYAEEVVFGRFWREKCGECFSGSRTSSLP